MGINATFATYGFMQENGGEIDWRFGAPAVFLLPPGNPQERHFSQIQENLKNG
jgi:hypothetical protein